MSELPLVSIMVFGYNQEQYIREAVQSALAQTYENLEIVMSDDASSDRTFAIMEEMAADYQGPHRIVLNRNPKNLGLSAHMSRVAEIASGELLVTQDGDDISFRERVSKLVQEWLSDKPRRGLVYSDVIRVAADGSPLPDQRRPLPLASLDDIARGTFFIAGGCVSAYSRILFDKYGPLHPSVKFNDYVLSFRAMLEGGCAFVDEPLIYYRVHDASIVQSWAKSEKTRSEVAHVAQQAVAEEESRLRDFDLSEQNHARLRRRLVRNLAYANLDASSSAGSKLNALACTICALAAGMPNAAMQFVRRDVLNLSGRSQMTSL